MFYLFICLSMLRNNALLYFHGGYCLGFDVQDLASHLRDSEDLACPNRESPKRAIGRDSFRSCRSFISSLCGSGQYDLNFLTKW